MCGRLFRPFVAALAFAVGLSAGYGRRAVDGLLSAAPDVPAPSYPRPALEDLILDGSRPYCDMVFCELHGDRVEHGAAVIEYGVAIPDPEREEAARCLFPLSNLVVRGGFADLKAPAGEVLFCPKCRAAERGWERERAGR